jgi:hypothetical protein
MAKKISELTVTTSIANTDLLEVSKDNGVGGYDSRKITFANLKAAVPSNPRTIDMVLGNNITGTLTMSKSASILIPANTVTVNSVIEIISRGIRVSGVANTIYHQMYINTSDSMTGATLLGVFTSLTTGQYWSQGTRQALIIPSTNTMKIFATGGTSSTDYLSTGAGSSITFNEAVDNYLIFGIQLFNTGDTGAIEFAKAVIYE